MEEILVNGFSLMFIVMGIVQWLKDAFDIQGKGVKVLSMSVGLILSVGYQLTLGIPDGYAAWFGVVIFGIGSGLSASGVYDAARQISKQ